MLIYVIDHHSLMREVVVMLLKRVKPDATILDFDRIAKVLQAQQPGSPPDLICMDIKLPDAQGVSGIRSMKSAYPKVPLVVLTALLPRDFEEPSLDAGADFFLMKSAGAAAISETLSKLIAAIEAPADLVASTRALSRRQLQLIKLVDEGLSNRDIADRLQISENTVKVHLWRLFRKLDVRSRTQAVHWARSEGLI